MVFQRRAGQAEPVAAFDGTGRLRNLGLGVLDRLGFIENQTVIFPLQVAFQIAVKQRVTGDQQIVILCRCEDIAPPPGSVQQRCLQPGGKTLRLAQPVAQHAGRSNNQGGAVEPSCLSFELQMT